METDRGVQEAAAVIVATGGKSIPKMGATSYGYRLAEAFGLPVTETRPALVPLTFAEQELVWMKPLAGVSVPGRASCGRTGFDESILFTHRGLSGRRSCRSPATGARARRCRWTLPRGRTRRGCCARPRWRRRGCSWRPRWRGWCPNGWRGIWPRPRACRGPLAEVPGAVLDRVAATLRDWSLRPVGSEGYRTAEVTLGGVETEALDARTMEARAVPGLYFVGEVVDVTGWLGGYNFQWAWSSGWAAGQVA